MNKKGMSIQGAGLALLLVVIVVLVFMNFGPKISELIKISIGFGSFDKSVSEEKPTATIPTLKTEREIKGKLGAVIIVKMEDTISKQKPTSPDHCMVGTIITNIGKTTWTDADKIRATLFCKYLTNQKEIVQNYPFGDYITELKPDEQKEVFFAGKFPNNCLESFEKYKIVLYSNCEGKGAENKPCDNFESAENHINILDTVEFVCPIS